MKAHDRTPIATPILIGLSLLLIGTAYITALWALTKVILPTSSKSPAVEEVQPAKFSPQIYQLEIVDRQIQLSPKTIHTVVTSPQLALTKALEKLLAQDPTFDPTTTIPAQTRLLNLEIGKDGVYIDLSQEFSQGGGSSSMIYRVAQVLYTASSIDPQTPVFLSIEGRPLNDDYPLGGEGLTLEYPMTRQQFNREFLADY
ncbi:MAG: GerMN domain-containing protein [Cyanobacteria bacterium P01_A01_bin.40]